MKIRSSCDEQFVNKLPLFHLLIFDPGRLKFKCQLLIFSRLIMGRFVENCTYKIPSMDGLKTQIKGKLHTVHVIRIQWWQFCSKKFGL